MVVRKEIEVSVRDEFFEGSLPLVSGSVLLSVEPKEEIVEPEVQRVFGEMKYDAFVGFTVLSDEGRAGFFRMGVSHETMARTTSEITHTRMCDTS